MERTQQERLAELDRKIADLEQQRTELVNEIDGLNHGVVVRDTSPTPRKLLLVPSTRSPRTRS